MVENLLHGDVTDRILQAAFRVHNELGHGFLENVYENALAYELRHMGIDVAQQDRVQVYYCGQLVGDYFADLVVDQKVIVELKAVKSLASEHEAQLLNYLRATAFEVGLLINFGTSLKFERKIMTNDRKRTRPSS